MDGCKSGGRRGSERSDIRSISWVCYGSCHDVQGRFVDNILDDGFENREQYDEEQCNAEEGSYDGGDDEPATLVDGCFGWSRRRNGCGLIGLHRFGRC